MKYKKGDLVSSVGGNFTKGIVEKAVNEKGDQILTVKWLKHKDMTGEIDFIQERSASIVRKLNA